jgi:hypothetical protein
MNRTFHSERNCPPCERRNPDHLDISNNSVNSNDDNYPPDRPSEAKHMKHFDKRRNRTSGDHFQNAHRPLRIEKNGQRGEYTGKGVLLADHTGCTVPTPQRVDLTYSYRIYRIAVGYVPCCAPGAFRRSLESQALDLRFVAAGDVSCVA